MILATKIDPNDFSDDDYPISEAMPHGDNQAANKLVRKLCPRLGAAELGRLHDAMAKHKIGRDLTADEICDIAEELYPGSTRGGGK